MKKQNIVFTTIILLVLFVLTSISAVSASATSSNEIDVNGDGIVNVFDLCYMKSSILNESNSPYSIVDLVKLKKFLLNIQDETPPTTVTTTTTAATTSTKITTITENTEEPIIYDLNKFSSSINDTWTIHYLATNYELAEIKNASSIELKLKEDESKSVIVKAPIIEIYTGVNDITIQNEGYHFVAFFPHVLSVDENQKAYSPEYCAIWYSEKDGYVIESKSSFSDIGTREIIEYPNPFDSDYSIEVAKSIFENAFFTSSNTDEDAIELTFEDNQNYYVFNFEKDVTDFTNYQVVASVVNKTHTVFELNYNPYDGTFKIFSYDEFDPIEKPMGETITTTDEPDEPFPIVINVSDEFEVSREEFWRIYDCITEEKLDSIFVDDCEELVYMYYPSKTLVCPYKDSSYTACDNLVLYCGDAITADSTQKVVIFNNGAKWFAQIYDNTNVTDTKPNCSVSADSNYNNTILPKTIMTELLVDVIETENEIVFKFEYFDHFDTISISKCTNVPETYKYLCTINVRGNIKYNVYFNADTNEYLVVQE